MNPKKRAPRVLSSVSPTEARAADGVTPVCDMSIIEVRRKGGDLMGGPLGVGLYTDCNTGKKRHIWKTYWNRHHHNIVYIMMPGH